MSPVHADHVIADVVCEGWVLKKRRKKMQGFARRYFTLHQPGILSYSSEPGHSIRDQISLLQAAITTAPGRKDIHVDSNTATFHMKCLSIDDFNMWMAAFRKYISVGLEARISASMRLASRHGNTTSISLNKSGTIAEEIGSTIASLEESIHLLTHHIPLQSKKNQSLGKKSEKDSKFGLFKRSSHNSPAQEFGGDSSSDIPFPPGLQRVLSVLDTLKDQHASLIASMQSLSDSHSPRGSPLPATAEEEETPRPHASPFFSTPTSGQSHRASIATSASDSVHEWFDALDGAEEFVMDVQITPEGMEQPRRMLTNESGSSLHETSSIDTDIEDGEHPPVTPTSAAPSREAFQVRRRTHLPTIPVGDEGSLFAILKKNVGKDLSTITFPVTFNEPLTLLQRAAEEVEYFSVLDDAARANNSIDRICYVAAFAVSSYAHTRHRSGRKGFNPMLGETFEDPRMKFIAEKVRHNPVEIAYHAEGDNWRLNATSCGRTKFWGKSLEIIPLGSSHLQIGQDHYMWKKPSSFMRNLMVGTKYLEHSGKMTIENTHDNTRCVLEFKQNGYWGATNVVSGTVLGASGDVVMELEGKWDDQMAQTIDSSNFRILWRMVPFPKNTHDYYGFTSFSITLNELTSDLVGRIPPTDSRLRPDVRALENGDIDIAEAEKIRVEEMQRERRRQGKDRQPRWFHQEGEAWVYSGGYWEARERGWKDDNIQPLW